MTTPSAQLAAFAAQLRFEDIPAQVVRRTEDLLVDWFGSAVAGHGSRPVETLTRVVMKMAPSSGTSLTQWSQGQTSIAFADRFDVAWRRTSVALDRAGFTVEDRDRKAGLFYVRYVDRPEEGKGEPGFFSRLFSSSSAQAPVRMRISVQEEGANSTRITVQNESGKADNGPIAQKIARLIHDELK